MVKRALLTICAASCTYNATFTDCSISCATAGCPDNLVCGTEGLCRLPGSTQTCATAIAAPSCNNLPATCGPAGNESCCTTAPVPGGTFFRSYDVGTDNMYPDMSYPATVSSFTLDRFEVTVGRFRAFVEAGDGTQRLPPTAGDGAHAKIPGSGWDPSWNGLLLADTATLAAALQCDAGYQTWTPAPGANEDLPINCVDWYEAAAFCAWDGGYLPTETEYNYAAAGGSEQRAYPWSNPTGSIAVDCTHANYDVNGGPTYCVPGIEGAVATMNRVGSESPVGDSKWGQADLGGNAWEWTLDWYAAFINPCNDCTNTTNGDHRVIRGGNFSHAEQFMRTANRGLTAVNNSLPTSRTHDVGFRCARP